MNTSQKEKLERYFRNADRFMWGVIPGDKRTTLATLRALLGELGEDSTVVPDHTKATYAMIIEILISKIGIERIVTQIVPELVRRQFADRSTALDFLRTHWMSGSLPSWQILQSLRAPKRIKQRIIDAVASKATTAKRKQTSDILDAFFDVNTQYDYVHRWTVFAGLWFEEIEPLLNKMV